MGRGQGKSRDPFASVFGSKRGAGRPNTVPKAHLWDDLDRLDGMSSSDFEAAVGQSAIYAVQVGPTDKDGVPQGWGEVEKKALSEVRKICKRLRLKKFGESETVKEDGYSEVLFDRGASVEELDEMGAGDLNWTMIVSLKLQRERIDEYRDLVRRLDELAIPAGIATKHGLAVKQ